MVKTVGLMAVVAMVAAVTACNRAGEGDPLPPAAPAAEVQQPASADSAGCGASELLPAPFTAKQIRDEWIPGFRLTMRRTSPADEAFERWRVVKADPEGVDIEYVTVDAGGNQIGEPAIRHSAWTELRDHASYPTARAARSREVRQTRLGRLSGWRYSVEDPDEGTISELFFADELPGAPVQMTIRRNGQPVLELEQVERERPAAPPPG